MKQLLLLAALLSHGCAHTCSTDKQIFGMEESGMAVGSWVLWEPQTLWQECVEGYWEVIDR